MTVPVLAGSVLGSQTASRSAPLIVLGASLGTTTSLWSDVASALAVDFRVLPFDLPGHGASAVATESFDVADLADAVVALVDAQGGGDFSYSGDSLGGAIGLVLAARHPDRLGGLVTFGAAAHFATPDAWRDRAALVPASGMAGVRSISEARWFPPGFVEANRTRVDALLDEQLGVDAESYALCCEAVGRYDFGSSAPSVSVPTTCVVGEFDIAAPPAEVRDLTDRIPGASFVEMPGAGHVPVFEQPAESERILRLALQKKGS